MSKQLMDDGITIMLSEYAAFSSIAYGESVPMPDGWNLFLQSVDCSNVDQSLGYFGLAYFKSRHSIATDDDGVRQVHRAQFGLHQRVDSRPVGRYRRCNCQNRPDVLQFDVLGRHATADRGRRDHGDLPAQR